MLIMCSITPEMAEIPPTEVQVLCCSHSCTGPIHAAQGGDTCVWDLLCTLVVFTFGLVSLSEAVISIQMPESTNNREGP